MFSLRAAGKQRATQGGKCVQGVRIAVNLSREYSFIDWFVRLLTRWETNVAAIGIVCGIALERRS
jgi:hypothetical protein